MMLTSLVFAFLSGMVTVASPCVLPVLPFLLSGTLGGRARPFGIIAGFVASFTAFTLFLSGLVTALGIPPETMRWISVALLFGFGLVLLVPALHHSFEAISSRSVGGVSQVQRGRSDGFWGGLVVGSTLGVLWTPCVGPIMASVITLALSGAVNLQALLVTLAFSTGTAIPMLAIMLGGRGLLRSVPWLTNNLSGIQRSFGVVLVVFALGIGFGLDRRFQAWVLDTFPGYADFITSLEGQAPPGSRLEVPR